MTNHLLGTGAAEPAGLQKIDTIKQSREDQTEGCERFQSGKDGTVSSSPSSAADWIDQKEVTMSSTYRLKATSTRKSRRRYRAQLGPHWDCKVLAASCCERPLTLPWRHPRIDYMSPVEFERQSGLAQAAARPNQVQARKPQSTELHRLIVVRVQLCQPCSSP